VHLIFCCLSVLKCTRGVRSVQPENLALDPSERLILVAIAALSPANPRFPGDLLCSDELRSV